MAGKIKVALMGIGFMALGAVGGTALSVSAAPGGPEMAEEARDLGASCSEDRGRRGKGRAMKRALSRMDLTETQKASIDTILEQARADRGERPEPGSRDRFATETVDRAAAHAALSERQDRARQRLDVRLDILEVLTMEQRAELTQRAEHSRRDGR
jgi:Spy/CpxP family protein refolding chaperone